MKAIQAAQRLLVAATIGSVLASPIGCAGSFGGGRSGAADPAASGGMDQQRMEILFGDEVDAIVGPPGAIQTQIDGISLYLISQPAVDRMRIIAPIAMAENLNRRVLEVLLSANFRSTLDARYAISDGVVYALFLHPISSLTPDLLRSGLWQVVSLVKTFGTTFSSGAISSGLVGPGATPEPGR